MEREYMLTQNWKLSLIYISQKRQGHTRLNFKEKRNTLGRKRACAHTVLDNFFWNSLKTVFKLYS